MSSESNSAARKPTTGAGSNITIKQTAVLSAYSQFMGIAAKVRSGAVVGYDTRLGATRKKLQRYRCGGVDH